MHDEAVDVLVVGAGLSGIGAMVHLRTHCPALTLAIVEARDAIGGTWDLFRYPGVRSDSDMHTLGYAFRPWTDAKAIADGPAILAYIRDTARDHGIDRQIRYGHRVCSASWSTPDACWTVELERGPQKERVRIRCGFLYMCSGYYDYEQGYAPRFPGAERFSGRIVHPQHWTDDIDYAGKRVVVIGSGATAVTVVPAMARSAAHVTMLQRSPTWMAVRPSEDRIANRLRRWLPARLAYALTRWKNVLYGMLVFQMCRRRPERVERLLLGMVRQELGPDYDIGRDFRPRYRPWDQRLCLVPDSDLFRAMRDGRASVVTDTIDTFTEHGIRLASGRELPADLVVSATGLNLKLLGGMEVSVDGVRTDFSQALSYKGMMFCGVPNLAAAFGYTNASWTLKADLTSEYVCRLLNHMKRIGARQCMARSPAPDTPRLPFVDFSSGYFQRALGAYPKRVDAKPWRANQNYLLDVMSLRHAPLEDGAMQFSAPAAPARQTVAMSA